jgi:hypothetical protein
MRAVAPVVLTMAIAITPLTAPALARRVDRAYSIGPSHVGYITPQTSKAQLRKIFPTAKLTDFTAYGPEGIGEFPATQVQIKGKTVLDVIWRSTARRRVASVQVRDSRWRTAEGVGLGMPVGDLHNRFGRFEFYGFGWDYGGNVLSNNPRLNRYLKQRGVFLSIGVDTKLCEQSWSDCSSLMGEQVLGSNNSIVRRLGGQVNSVSVSFEGRR